MAVDVDRTCGLRRRRVDRVALAAVLLGSVDAQGQEPASPTYDHAEVQAMVDAAGENGVVEFAPQTYTICRKLIPRNGQVWELNGATLKLCDAVSSPLTVPASAGTTAVAVEDASVFEVGQRVTPIRGPAEMDGERDLPHVVLAIIGNAVFFSNPLGQDYAVGDPLIVVEPIVESWQLPGPAGWVLRGGTIDGNRRANLRHVAWQLAYAVQASGQGILIEDMAFRDCWGSCINAWRLFDSTIRDSAFDGGATAAIHLSTTTGLRIENSAFRGFNADAALGGHSEGTITWSHHSRDAVLDRVCIEDMHPSGEAAIGRTAFSVTRGIEIKHSRFCRVPGIWSGQLLLPPEPGYDPTGDVSIHHNYAVAAGHSRFYLDPAYASSFRNFAVRDNVLVDTSHDWSSVPGASLENNAAFSGEAPCSCLGWVESVGSAPDADADGRGDDADNCPDLPNPMQQDRDGDALGDVCDRCPDYATSDNGDFDGNGIGDACECGDQTRDAVVNVLDLIGINLVIFGSVRASPLCDTNFDDRCDVHDIVGAGRKAFGAPAYCSRYPPPGASSAPP